MESELASLSRLVKRQVDVYNDGKASPSRLRRLVIDDVFCRDDLSVGGRRLWKAALKRDFRNVFESCVHYVGPNGSSTRQFWDWNCTTFVVGHILNDEETIRDPILFARRPSGFGWYGVNWNYMLDIGGRVRRRCLKSWRQCADAQGQVMRWNRDAGKYHYFDKKTGRKVDA